jgi:tetratricopeptide (TPR) repeat protein
MPQEQDLESELLAEAMALVVLPYASCDGLVERAEALEAIAAEHGFPRLAALGKLARADVIGRQQQVPESVRLSHEVLHWAEATGDRLVAARAQALLATSLWRLGAWSEAVPRSEQAVRLIDAGAPLAIQADHALIFALLACLRAGKLDVTNFEHADDLARQLGDPIMIVANLNNLAWSQYLDGDIAGAAVTVDELRKTAEAGGHELAANVVDTVAMVLLQTGHPEEAERMLTEALDGGTPLTEADSVAAMLMTYSEIKLQAGEHEAALAAIRRCQAVIDGKQLGEAGASASRQLAAIHAARGDYRAAYEAMLDFTAQWEELRSLQAEATA